MPGTFLTAAERERLACFPDAVSHPDLMTYFAAIPAHSLATSSFDVNGMIC
jgi:hypothetical protein